MSNLEKSSDAAEKISKETAIEAVVKPKEEGLDV